MQTNLERALDENRIPWTEIEYRTKEYWVFKEISGRESHLLFVPTKETFVNLTECYKAAYKFGYNGIVAEKWKTFKIEQHIDGIKYPHISMIPDEDN